MVKKGINMPLKIVCGDICKMDVDAIVNAANSALKMGGGVCGAIFRAAGEKQLAKECGSIGGCDTGKAVLTKGYNLLSKYIIHTVGPIWRGGWEGEKELLRGCYKNSLNLAASSGCKSVAFPLISAGIYGYPKEQAIEAAVTSIKEFLKSNVMEVYLVLFDSDDINIAEKISDSVNS